VTAISPQEKGIIFTLYILMISAALAALLGSSVALWRATRPRVAIATPTPRRRWRRGFSLRQYLRRCCWHRRRIMSIEVTELSNVVMGVESAESSV
jgi:hypothetical protein